MDLISGYYSDPEAECQVFHICTADGAGGLAKYSFLCPNGTIFNQNYFICDWWFNVDCAESAAIAEAKNAEVAGAREAASAAAGEFVRGSEIFSSSFYLQPLLLTPWSPTLPPLRLMRPPQMLLEDILPLRRILTRPVRI